MRWDIITAVVVGAYIAGLVRAEARGRAMARDLSRRIRHYRAGAR